MNLSGESDNGFCSVVVEFYGNLFMDFIFKYLKATASVNKLTIQIIVQNNYVFSVYQLLWYLINVLDFKL